MINGLNALPCLGIPGAQHRIHELLNLQANVFDVRTVEKGSHGHGCIADRRGSSSFAGGRAVQAKLSGKIAGFVQKVLQQMLTHLRAVCMHASLASRRHC